MVTKETSEYGTNVNPLEITDPDVKFSATIVSFELKEGTASFEFTTEETDQTYVSTMDATYTMNGRSEFKQFLNKNDINEPKEVLNKTPIGCDVVSERENDVVKFEIDSIDAEVDEEVTFEEITSFGIGAVAGLAPVSNVLFLATMMVHTMGKDNRTDSDVTFLFGTFMSMIGSFVVAFPFLM